MKDVIVSQLGDSSTINATARNRILLHLDTRLCQCHVICKLKLILISHVGYTNSDRKNPPKDSFPIRIGQQYITILIIFLIEQIIRWGCGANKQFARYLS